MIRNAQPEDLGPILEIYAQARAYMARTGNPTQWGTTHPRQEQLEEDIALGRLYVICGEDGAPHGVFMLLLEPEPTYAVIDGAWPNDRPYGTIHRLAGDGTIPGLFAQCLAFCLRRSPDLRADTHPNNKTMQHLLEKHGFVRCGTIYLNRTEGDDLRIAYQYEGKGER